MIEIIDTIDELRLRSGNPVFLSLISVKARIASPVKFNIETLNIWLRENCSSQTSVEDFGDYIKVYFQNKGDWALFKICFL